MEHWDQPGIPQKGWELLEVVDLGYPQATCQMCGKTDIRYFHHVDHPEHEDIWVGCVCAEKMTGNYLEPKRRERRLRDRIYRRASGVNLPEVVGW